MRSILLKKENKLIISIRTKCITENIKKSVIYIILNVNTYKAKSFYIKISKK